jgi:hypothetical protein
MLQCVQVTNDPAAIIHPSAIVRVTTLLLNYHWLLLITNVGIACNSVGIANMLCPVLCLTPKGPTVPTGDKPVLGSVTWSLTISRFFETFFPNASRNRLCVSTNFMILGATDQKLWVFEVFRLSSGNQKTFYFLTFLGWIFFIDS